MGDIIASRSTMQGRVWGGPTGLWKSVGFGTQAFSLGCHIAGLWPFGTGALWARRGGGIYGMLANGKLHSDWGTVVTEVTKIQL